MDDPQRRETMAPSDGLDAGDRPAAGSSALTAAAALIAVLFLLSGRWGLGRLGGEYDIELRWVVIALGVAVLGACLVAGPSALRCRLLLGRLYTLWLLFLYLALSSVWAPSSELARAKLTDVMVLACGVGLVALLAGLSRRDFTRWFWLWMVALCAVIGLAGVLSSGAEVGRVAAFGGGPNVFGRNMVFLLIGSLFFYFRGVPAALVLPLIGLGLVGLFLSGSRGSMLAALPAILLFVALHMRSARRVVSLVALLAALAGVGLQTTELGQRVLRVYELRVVELTVQETHWAGRDMLFDRAMRLGDEGMPWGAGLNAFAARVGGYPHNLVLEVYVEAGLPGLLLLALVLAQAAWLLLGRVRDYPPIDYSAIAAIAFFALAGLISGDLYDNRALFLLLVAPLCYEPCRRTSDASTG
jgi:O-antigen ligase